MKNIAPSLGLEEIAEEEFYADTPGSAKEITNMFTENYFGFLIDNIARLASEKVTHVFYEHPSRIMVARINDCPGCVHRHRTPIYEVKTHRISYEDDYRHISDIRAFLDSLYFNDGLVNAILIKEGLAFHTADIERMRIDRDDNLMTQLEDAANQIGMINIQTSYIPMVIDETYEYYPVLQFSDPIAHLKPS